MQARGPPRPPLRLATWLLLALAAGCAGVDGPGRAGLPQSAPETYVVRSGDTLFGIARRFGLDHRDVARWNRLGDGTLIYPGQRLRLRPPGGTAGPAGAGSTAEAATVPPPARWQWPTDGQVILAFGQSAKTASGVLIAGTPGQPVRAAAGGEVVYAGSGLSGYGQLVIVRHNAGWLSAYGHNEQLLVREGEPVQGGQPIARMGAGAGRDAVLHFEIRRDGVPVDPLRFLPAP